jgi:hypothetical protein
MKFASILLGLAPLAAFVDAAVLHSSNVRGVQREHREHQAMHEGVTRSGALGREAKTGSNSNGFLPRSIDNTGNRGELDHFNQ